MSNFARHTPYLLCLVLASAWAQPADNQRIVRDRSTIAAATVHGISLSMTPEAAFNTLLAAGFRAGSLTQFSDWDSEGVEFVRGEYGSRDGYSSLTFERQGGEIVRISETYNAPGNPIDAEALIRDLRDHFAVTGEMRRCSAAGPHRGFCEIQDTAELADAVYMATYQIATTMRIITIRRRPPR